MSIFAEAFSALNLVEAKNFKVGVKEDDQELLDFMNDDAVDDDTVDVIDPEAVAKEDGEELDDNDHTGDIICRCPECQSLIFFAKDDLVKDDEEELVNIDEECPYCKTVHGFVVIGEVQPFETDEVEVTDKADDEEAPVDEEPEEAPKDDDNEEPIDEAFDSIKGGLKGASVGGAIGSVLGPVGTLAGARLGNAIGKTVGKVQGIANQLGGDKKDEEPVAESVEECGKFDKLPSRKMHESKKRIDNRNHSLKEAREMSADANQQKLKDKPTTTSGILDKNTDFMWSLYSCKSAQEVADKFKTFAEKNNIGNLNGVKRLLSNITRKNDAYKAADAVKDFWLAGQGRGMSRFNSRTRTEDLEEANGEAKKFFKEYEVRVDGRVYENSYTEGRANYISNYFREKGSDVEVTPKKVLIRGEFAINKRNKLIAEQEAEYAEGKVEESLTEAKKPWHGCNEIEFVSHGTQADADLIYKGYTFNYNDIEDALWGDFCEETGCSDSESGDPEVEKEFNEYVCAEAPSYLDDVIAGGYFSDGSTSWHDEFKESLKEAVQNVSIDTDQETITVATKQDTAGAEMIAPASDDIMDEIPTEEEAEAPAEDLPVEDTGLEDTGDLDLGDNEVDVDVDEFDEDEFSGMGESYLRKTYNNVESFKTTGFTFKGNTIFVEGLITFKGGKTSKTSFVFEGKHSHDGKFYFEGYNKHLTESNNAFGLVARPEGKKLMVESFNWNYDAKDENGNIQKLSGTRKRNK